MNTKASSACKNTTKEKKTKQDVVYTPDIVAQDCMKAIQYKIKPTDILFEPFYGLGAFYDLFGDNPKTFSEIDMGLDFFEEDNDMEVDYIITNPPYSIMTQIIKKMLSMKNLKGFGLLVNNLTMTPKRLKTLEENNFYPTDMYLFKIHSWFGYQNFWFFEKLDKKPQTNFTFKGSQYMY